MKKIILGTSNSGKITELKEMLSDYDAIPYTDIIEEIDIVEDGCSFIHNAAIKSAAVYAAVNDENAVILADDSGVRIDGLNGAPGVNSRRYAGNNASWEDNMALVIRELKDRGYTHSCATMHTAISIYSKDKVFTMEAMLRGTIITEPRGDVVFGYDQLFIPEGQTLTMSELGMNIRNNISSRAAALREVIQILNIN